MKCTCLWLIVPSANFFELTVKAYLPEYSHKKLPGLCKTRWVERHSCLDVFLEMYEAVITFLDAIISPSAYPDWLMVTQVGTRIEPLQ